MLNMSDNPTVSMINKMKVPELQAELTKRHLDTKGTKQVLVNRLLSSLEIVEPEAANDSNDDEQQNKAEGNMELAQDEGQDDCKDDEQDHSKDENQSSLNELYPNYKHPYSFENAIQDIRLQLNILQCKFEDYKTEMSNDASGTGSLRDENKRLRCENTDLTERMNNLGLILADLNTKLKIAEDEKASLLTAIRLIQSDGDVKLNNNNNIMTTKHLPQNTYKEVASRPKSRNINGNSSSKQDNLKTTAAGPNLVNVLGSNRFSPLEVETADESEQEIISADEARPTSHGRKHDSKTQKSKKTTSDSLNKVDCSSSNVSTIHDLDSVTILGDSMLKRLDVNRVRRSIDSNKRVIIRTFSGATIEDMKHYVEPTLKRSPKAIIVHAGTNNIPRDRPEEIVSKLNDLGQHIEQNSKCQVIISSLITRSDDNLNAKISTTNNLLANLCLKNNWLFIKHINISKSHLNASGLHLNARGTSTLARNLIDCIKH